MTQNDHLSNGTASACVVFSVNHRCGGCLGGEHRMTALAVAATLRPAAATHHRCGRPSHGVSAVPCRSLSIDTKLQPATRQRADA